MLHDRGAKKIAGPVRQAGDGAQIQCHIRAGLYQPADFLVGQGKLGQQFHDGAFFGLSRLGEFAPRRCVEEQVLDGDGRAAVARCRFAAHQLSAGDLDQTPHIFGRTTADAADQTDRGDTGQGLTPKTETGDLHDVGCRGYFAGGVPLKGQRQFTERDAVAVIVDGQARQSAILHGDRDVAGTSVQGVFDQFLDDGSRSFDDLTSGDTVDRGVVQNSDLAEIV